VHLERDNTVVVTAAALLSTDVSVSLIRMKQKEGWRNQMHHVLP